MSRRRLSSLPSAVLACFAVAFAARADEGYHWASDALDAPLHDALRYDHEVRLAQAAAESRSPRSSGRTSLRTARTSRVPYMIGDSPSSPSGDMGAALSFRGIEVAAIEHPAFGGNRFNVAENGCVLPTDRVYVNYRHFNSAYDSIVLGQGAAADVDRFDLGFEKTAFDGLLSAELRVPFVRQLNSDLDIYSDNLGNSNLPLTDRHGELGNLAVNFKLLLVGQRSFAVATGVAVNCPTGDDTRITQSFDEPNLVLAQSPLISSIAPTNLALNARIDNDTVNLVPFVAWLARPTGRLFHQGFLQIDAPLNRSDASVQVVGEITPDSLLDDEAFNVSQIGEIDQQTLLRLNLAFGYWIYQGGGAVRGAAAIFEAHYTAALDNANPLIVSVTQLDALGPGVNDVPLDVVAGPVHNTIDQVNLTAGLALDLGSCQVTNGLVMPVTENQDRSFDFEYSLMVNRRF